MKGYKVFEPDWTCRGFQYEVGQTYTHEGPIRPCSSGFHFCAAPADCFEYHRFDPDNKVAEVEAIGQTIIDGNKTVTDQIVIVREIPWAELLTLVNQGKENTGLCNTGDCNTGDWNTGNCNTGNRNTGFANQCNFESGAFNTVEANIRIFNKEFPMTARDFYNSEYYDALRDGGFALTEWVSAHSMTDEEKAANPSWETADGYLRRNGYKEAWAKNWANKSETNRAIVLTMPGFDADIFFEITGINTTK